jgi:hypothetical protein
VGGGRLCFVVGCVDNYTGIYSFAQGARLVRNRLSSSMYHRREDTIVRPEDFERYLMIRISDHDAGIQHLI